MFRLASIFFPIIATALCGGAVTAVLAANLVTPYYIIGAVAAGLVLSLPISIILGKKLYQAAK